MIGDFFRFWWTLVHLNVRQTLYRLRRARGRCPCQAPSDSGQAWKTHCEESDTWNRPERLRHVCPHLRRGPDGWRCSVNAADVRPHWARALGFYAAAGGGLYFVAALAAFGALSWQGFPGLSPLDTLVPTRWSRIATTRSAHFLAKAQDSLARGDVRATHVNLASANTTAGDNYEVRLSVAQANSYLSSDAPASIAFRALLEAFPDKRPRTAVAYHDVMVALRAFDDLGDFASEQLATPGVIEAPAWLRALFVSLRGSARPDQVLARNTAKLQSLPPLWLSALQAEAEIRRGNLVAIDRLYGQPLKPDEAPLLATIGETIAEFAPTATAIDEIIRLGPAVGNFERERLLFRLHARLNAGASALKAFDAMLRLANQPQHRERLLAALVEFPDRTRVGRLASAANNPNTPFTSHELGALWVAASMTSDSALRELAAQRLAAQHKITIAPGMISQPSAGNTSLWMRTIPLGRESAWALALAFAPQRSAVRNRTARVN